MSQILKELKNKAMKKIYSHGAFGEPENYMRLDADKFAELIIQECINVLRANGELAKNTCGMEALKGFAFFNASANIIKTHFEE